MTDRLLIGAALAYAAVGLAAFGHAAAANSTPEAFAACRAHKYCIDSDIKMGAVAAGLMAGIFWPLYGPWLAFDEARREQAA